MFFVSFFPLLEDCRQKKVMEEEGCGRSQVERWAARLGVLLICGQKCNRRDFLSSSFSSSWTAGGDPWPLNTFHKYHWRGGAGDLSRFVDTETNERISRFIWSCRQRCSREKTWRCQRVTSQNSFTNNRFFSEPGGKALFSPSFWCAVCYFKLGLRKPARWETGRSMAVGGVSRKIQFSSLKVLFVKSSLNVKIKSFSN